VGGRRLVVFVLVGSFALIAAGVGAARTSTSLRGTWSCCGSGGAGAQTWKISSMSASGGSFSGSGGGGAYTFPITGELVGRSLTLTTGPYIQLPSYSATFKGTLSKSGKTMSGTWTSNESQSGTWTAKLTSGGPKPAAKCKVPAMKGLPLARAKRALGSAHCSVGKVKTVSSPAAKKGRVISQSRKAGSSLPADTRVSLTIGGGKKRSHRHH
jgi:PASTA domain